MAAPQYVQLFLIKKYLHHRKETYSTIIVNLPDKTFIFIGIFVSTLATPSVHHILGFPHLIFLRALAQHRDLQTKQALSTTFPLACLNLRCHPRHDLKYYFKLLKFLCFQCNKTMIILRKTSTLIK